MARLQDCVCLLEGRKQLLSIETQPEAYLSVLYNAFNKELFEKSLPPLEECIVDGQKCLCSIRRTTDDKILIHIPVRDTITEYETFLLHIMSVYHLLIANDKDCLLTDDGQRMCGYHSSFSMEGDKIKKHYYIFVTTLGETVIGKEVFPVS